MGLTGRRICSVLMGLSALIGIVGGAQAEALSRADFAAHKRQIEADYRADSASCARRTGRDRSVCQVEAQARRKVAMAELDYNTSGNEADASRLAVAKGDLDFVVARERCDSMLDRATRERCIAQAEAVRIRALNPARTVPLRRF